MNKSFRNPPRLSRRAALLGSSAAVICGGVGEARANGFEFGLVVGANGPAATPSPAVMPSGLGWDNTRFPFTASLYDTYGLARAVGSVSQTPEGFFNAVSTALSAPGATFYVNINTGADTNAGTSAAPFASINKAVTAANTANVPTLIYVAAGIYPRANSPGGTSGITPTVDVAFVATGGRVITGVFDQYPTPSADGTYTNCYSYATGNSDRVVDLLTSNQYGNYNELQNVPTAAICNATPNSWASVSGTLYVHRGDGLAVTNANTRVYRALSYTWYFLHQVNVYMGDGGITPANFPPCGFDTEGADNNTYYGGAGLDYYIATPNNSIFNVIAVKNCTFKYAGGYLINTTSRNVGMLNHNGLACFFNCRADAAMTDGFNHHNPAAAAESLVLTVNCTGHDNGRSGNTSCNGWTSHDTCIGVDVAGYYSGNHGGTARSIQNSRAWFVGTLIENDKGDTTLNGGGTIYPDAFSVQGSAQYWCDRTKVNMPSGQSIAYLTETSGSAIYLHNPWPVGATVGGPGTITTY